MEIYQKKILIGGILLLLSSGFSYIFRYMSRVLIIRFTGFEIYGYFLLLFNAASSLSIILSFGLSNVLTLNIPKFSDNDKVEVTNTLIKLLIIFYPVLTSLSFLFFGIYTQFELLLLSILTFSMITFVLLKSLFNGLGWFQYVFIITSIVEILFLFILVFCFLLEGSILVGIIELYILSHFGTFIILCIIFIAKKVIRVEFLLNFSFKSLKFIQFKELFSFYLIDISNFAYPTIILFLIGFFFDLETVGLYGSLILLINLGHLISISLFQSINPTYVSLFNTSDFRTLLPLFIKVKGLTHFLSSIYILLSYSFGITLLTIMINYSINQTEFLLVALLLFGLIFESSADINIMHIRGTKNVNFVVISKLCYLISMIFSIILLNDHYGIIGIGLGVIASQILIYLLTESFIFIKYPWMRDSSITKNFIKTAIIPVILASFLFNYLSSSVFIIICICGVLLIGFYVLVFKNEEMLDLRSLFSRK